MNANWERVRTLFQSALDRPADLRASFLSEACADDDVTRREVESLLIAYGDSEGFLESPPIDASVPDVTETSLELEPGDRIGDFEVASTLGAGGMGQVYRARDHKLHRDVAIKLLPRALAEDPDRLSRFERESRILAALNHPHIATIHSIEHEDGRHALIMELVDGQTLAERLKGGALEIRQALVFARELAGALEAAHGKGVVHRDLKPANIKFTSSGSLKLLDFGLAKEIAEPDVAAPSRLPADVLKSTDGLIVGTCAYMSPEQARGLPVDKRTDIWAFGCLLYEMLSGRRAFAGETVAETIKAVVEEPPDWTALPPATPTSIRRLLQRCVEKDPHRRLHDIADARIEIDDALQGENRVQTAASALVPGTLGRVALIVVLGALAVGAGWWLRSAAGFVSPAVRVARSTWPLPDGSALSSAPAVSPDGQHIAFTASAKGQRSSRLHVRALSGLDARAIPGTDGADHPFWSPDSRFVAYFTQGKLMKVAVDGGGPVEICATRAGRGGAWSQAGVIVFSGDLLDAGLSRVSANGGPVEPATLLDAARGERTHRWPVFLPDGVHFLYFVRSLGEDRRGVFLGRIDRPPTVPAEPLFRSDSDAQYVPFDRDSGVLVSAANGHLEVRQFDPQRLTLFGDPTTLDLPVGSLTTYHAAMFSASPDVLTYVATSIPYGVRFASVNRDGSNLSVREQRQVLNWPRLSPDGGRIVYQNFDASAGSPDLVVEDLERGSTQTVTKPGGAGLLPVWSPAGDRLAYVTGTAAKPSLVVGAADGTGALSTIACPGSRCVASDWSADGLLATVTDGGRSDVWILQTRTGETTRPLLDESYVERDARFSGDGLVAYVSHASGTPEVAIQRIDGAPARDVVSVGGGDQPVWRRDGRELFFVDPKGALHAVSVSQGPTGRPVVGKPLPVEVPAIGFGHNSTQYDVSPDGRRIYFFDRRREPPPAEVGVVLGWRALIK